MTERLYYTSDATEGRTQVIRCTEEPDGRYAIELNQTLFGSRMDRRDSGRSDIPAWGACRPHSARSAYARRGGDASR